MSQSILIEIYIFCRAFLLGILFVAVYDVLRIFRRVIKHGTLLIALEDILIMSGYALITFVMIYQNNAGNVRGYILVAMGLGALLYLVSLSAPFVNFTSKILLIVLQKVVKAYKMITRKIKIEVRPRNEKSKSKKSGKIK